MEKKWVVLLLVVGVIVGSWWYWNQRPANVQAAISVVRDASNVTDVMTVEAVSEAARRWSDATSRYPTPVSRM